MCRYLLMQSPLLPSLLLCFTVETGIHWRDLPERLAKWNSVYQRFNHRSKREVWEKHELTTEPDLHLVVISSTTIRANQVAAGQKNSIAKSCMGRSSGRLSSKIHLIVNAVDRFCRLIVGTGNESDYKQASGFTKDYQPLAAPANIAYDDWWIRELPMGK